jgi:hypothetical protein
MRGRLAAACAAVLVGLSPAGALPFASFAAVSVQVCDAAVQRSASAKVSRAEPIATAALRVKPAVAVHRAFAAAALRIWRSPSGPAPSQAPPAI